MSENGNPSSLHTSLTWLLTGLVFLAGLGLGPAGNDLHYWYDSSRMILSMEGLFILVYVLIGKTPLHLIHELWSRHRRITLLSLLWILTVIVSSLVAPYYNISDNPLATMRLIETLCHFIFFAALYNWLSGLQAENCRSLLSALVFSALIVLAFSVSGIVLSPSSEAPGLHPVLSLGGISINTNIRRIGYQMEVAILALFPFILFGSRRHLLLLPAGAMLWFSLWLGGRAALLGIVAAITASGLFIGWRRALRWVLFTLSALLLFHFLDQYSGWIDSGYSGSRVVQTLHASSFEALSSGRGETWIRVLRELRGHLLLGTGPQSYFFYPGRAPSIIHAHNFLLQFLGEWGLLGTGLFLYLLVHGVLLGWRRARAEISATGRISLCRLSAGLVLTGLTVTGLFGGTYFFPLSSFYLALAFAFWTRPRLHPE